MSAQQKPFAWAYRKKEDGYPTFSFEQEWPVGMVKEFGGEVIPLYRQPQPTLTAEEFHGVIARLEAENERLCEAIRRLADQDATLSLLLKRDGSQVVTVTMDATLTDAEREAIQEVIDYLQPAGQRHQNHVAATLRGLLERLK